MIPIYVNYVWLPFRPLYARFLASTSMVLRCKYAEHKASFEVCYGFRSAVFVEILEHCVFCPNKKKPLCSEAYGNELAEVR